MEPDKSDVLTQVLATWGAVLSSITFFWALYKDQLDRANLKVTAKLRRIGRREIDGQGYASEPSINFRGLSDELFVVVTVTNIGRRPINWKSWGGTYRTPVNGHSTFVVSARELPKMLDEQQEHVEFTGLDRHLGTGNLKGIQVWDGTGRKWEVPSAEIKELLSDIKKYAVPPADQQEMAEQTPGGGKA
jgi:hypothetical protein